MLERRGLTKNGAYFMSCFVASLRGGKGFMMYVAGFWHHIRKGREGPLARVVIPLIVRFKGELGIIHNLQAVVNETATKLKVG